MKLQRKSNGLTALAIAGVTLMAMSIESPVASADVEIWNTPSGSVDSSHDPVSAQATFNISSGEIVITLSNLQTGIHAAGQVVSDLSFTTVNASDLSSSVLANVYSLTLFCHTNTSESFHLTPRIPILTGAGNLPSETY